MYEQTFTRIENKLRKDAGMSTELDYVEQTSWVLFLKYLCDMETELASRAQLEGRAYTAILDEPYSWRRWAMPLKPDGKADIANILTGDDLIDFVNDKLLPYLKSFRAKAESPKTLHYKIGEVFTELKSRFRSGYVLRDVIEEVDKLTFNQQAALHELSKLYETRIHRMGNAGRNGGEYYTPRPLIRAMIRVIKPTIGETIYDGAAGTAGFLCEAFAYLKTGKLSATDFEKLQTSTLYGQEKKPLPYIVGIVNMILHGIEAPNLVHTNTLTENVTNISPRDKHDVILANPPFGGDEERKEVEHNFPIRSSEPAYLFLQHYIHKLKKKGRAAVVIKNTVLSNGDGMELRKTLLTTCNLHTVLDCPSGTFQGSSTNVVVLFFERGGATKGIWYYQLDPGRSLGKTNPLNDEDMAEFLELQKTRADSDKSWCVSVADLDKKTYDLSVKNPNAPQEAPPRPPADIVADMQARDTDIRATLNKLEEMVG